MQYTSSSIVVNQLVSDIHDFTVMNYHKQSIIRVQDASVILNFANRIPGYCINSFVKNVVVAIIKGNRFYFDESDTPRVASINRKLMFFTETANGESFEIIDENLCEILSQFPKFAMSNDGMMVFYTSGQLVATYDCKSCVSVKQSEMDIPFNSISTGRNGKLVINGASELDLDFYIYPDFGLNDRPLLKGVDII